MPLLPSQWIFHTFLWSVLCLFWWYSSHECFECSLCWTLTSLMWRFFFSVLKTAKYFRHHFPTHSENKVLFNKKNPHPKNTDPNRFSIKRRVLFENQSCLIGLVFWFFFFTSKYKLNRDPGKYCAWTFFSLSIPWTCSPENWRVCRSPGQLYPWGYISLTCCTVL